jgi:hypothetical protein
MTRRIAAPIFVVASLFVAGVAFVAAQELTNVWRNPEAGPLAFAGKKVIAVVMTGDQNLEVSGEEALVRELNARGVSGVAAYRMIPREELKDPEKAKGWVTRAKGDGVVVLRVLSSDKETTYRPSMWVTSSYSTLWSYWGYGWTSVWVAGGKETNRYVSVETLVYNVAKDQLVWAGVSAIQNPKTMQKTIAGLVTDVVAEMTKNGLIPK